MYLNGAPSNTTERYDTNTKDTDDTLDAFYVGSSYTNPMLQSYFDLNGFTNRRLDTKFHGDITGLFVVDELPITDATTAIYDNMVLGFDFTNTTCPSGNTCTACPAG